ncbi:MAG: O-antigen ligase family protein [Saprospiraceae bacterium]|nr:O-antigen ligase family protein [Saprospiraceae bacterium]
MEFFLLSTLYSNNSTIEQSNNYILLDKWGRRFLTLLTIFMALRIASYFTLFPSSIGITRVLKIGLRIVLTGLSVGLYFVLKSRFGNFKIQYKMASPMVFYLMYLLLGVISIFWSTGKGFSMLQLGMTIETMVFSYLFYQVIMMFEAAYRIKRSFYSRILARSILWVCLAFILGMFVNPDLFFRGTHGGEVQRLGGFIINPNELGMLAVLGAAMGYIELLNKQNKVYNYIVVIGCVAVLLLSQSRSSLGAFILVSGIYVLLMDNYYVKVAIIVGGVLVMPVVLNTIVFKQGNVEEVMSMTGRLPFWADLIEEAFVDRPILGYGFMRISPNSFDDKFESVHAYAASMTHNTFVQVLINLGLVGTFIMILQMMSTFFAITIEKDKWLKYAAIFQIIPLLINSATEFGIFGETNYGIYVLSIAIFNVYFLCN